MSTPAALGDKVRRARLEAGLTQAALAGTEVSVRTISRIETGHTTPSRRVLAYVARRVGRPLGYFVDGDASCVDADVASLVLLARARRLAGDLDAALRTARDADERARALDDLPGRWRAALERAVCEFVCSGSPEDEARVRAAQAGARRARLHEDVWWAEYAVAAHAAAHGDHDRARALLERLVAGLDGIDRVRDLAGMAGTLEAEAQAAHAAGRTEEARWAARQAVAVRAAVRALAEEAQVRYEVGAALLASGMGADAEAELVRARALAREAGEPLVETQALVALGQRYAGAGRFAEAAVMLEQAQALCAGRLPVDAVGRLAVPVP